MMKGCDMDKPKTKERESMERMALAEALERLPEILSMMDMMRPPEMEREEGEERGGMEHERGEMRGPGMMVISIEKGDKKKAKGKG